MLAISAHRSGSASDLIIALLGLNLWVSLLVVPFSYQPEQLTAAFALSMAVGPIVLIVGLLWHNRVVLLTAYPLSLLTPCVLRPRLLDLLGIDSAWTVLVVSVGLVAYSLGTAWLLTGRERPARLADPQPVESSESEPWSRLRRIHALLLGFAVVMPAVLIFGLFFQQQTMARLARSFPERSAAATAVFGALFLCLWVVVFFVGLAKPWRLRLLTFGRTADRQPQRAQSVRYLIDSQFYLLAALALVSMLGLTLWVYYTRL